MVDFSKRLGQPSRDNAVDPIALYESLDRGVDTGPLRPAQAAVLEEWHREKRGVRDLILKMHTGQGKTLVGLLLLQSKLNEGKGPGLYLCPNKYLVEQTCFQARRFGIKTCLAPDDLPAEFLDGSTILVTTVQKLFNGLTKFGFGKQAAHVGAIIVDDAHASVDAIRDAFRIKIHKDQDAYARLLALFHDALATQGAGSLADIDAGNHNALLPVPYWEWRTRHDEVVTILAAEARRPRGTQDKDKDNIKFPWALLKDEMENCQALVSGSTFEIEPYLPRLDQFASFVRAGQRVFMSATTADDSFLVKGLRISSEAIRSPLVYKEERWSGEKMVLIPSLIDDSLDRTKMVNALGKPYPKRAFGTVVLVPGERRTLDWAACGSIVATKETLEAQIGRLRSGDFAAPLVLKNRYDGIDLPDAMCRLLVVDSRPYSDNLVDRYADNCRPTSDTTALRAAKRIEQGLGRSVRGEKDYSVVVIIGEDLVKTVRTPQGQRYLSPQTRAQIEIGLEIADLAKAESAKGGDAPAVLVSLINQCLKRDKDWKAFYAERMEKVKAGSTSPAMLAVLEQEVRAETDFLAGHPDRACDTLQALVDKFVKDDEERGWYLQEMARYLWPNSRTDSERLQVVAHTKNRLLLRPKSGMVFVPLKVLSEKRVGAIVSLVRTFASYEDLRLHVDAILSDLHFGVAADKFERAFESLGALLGFGSQRPDKEYKDGPDNLWAIREGEYVLAECKSEVDVKRADINKAEAAQMNTSCAWFAKNYAGARSTNVLVHPAGAAGKAAHFTHPVRVLRAHGLSKLRRAVFAFYSEFKAVDLRDVEEKKVQERLAAHNLDSPSFMDAMTVVPRES